MSAIVFNRPGYKHIVYTKIGIFNLPTKNLLSFCDTLLEGGGDTLKYQCTIHMVGWSDFKPRLEFNCKNKHKIKIINIHLWKFVYLLIYAALIICLLWFVCLFWSVCLKLQFLFDALGWTNRNSVKNDYMLNLIILFNNHANTVYS